MGIIIDIAGSLMIRGIIVFVVLQMNLALHETLYEKSAQSTLKKNLSVASGVLANDLRHAGHNAAGTVFTRMGSQDIRFNADLNNDGTAESVRYVLGDTVAAVPGQNPSLRRLYRTVDGSTMAIAENIVALEFRYLTATGSVTSDPALVRSVNLSVRVESHEQYGGRYLTSSWQRRIHPLNLR